MNQRTQRVGSLLTSEISAFVARHVEPPNGCLITIMHAEVTPDLKQAKVYISVLPEHLRGSALHELKKSSRELQRIIGKKFTMKFVPRIEWVIDDTSEKYDLIDRALKG